MDRVAHIGRPWLSVSTHRKSVAVHQYTYQHSVPWTQHVGPSRGLFGWFWPTWTVCSVHTGRQWVSASTHRTSLAVRGCPSGHTGRPWLSVSTHRTSVDCPSVHISARWPFPWTVRGILAHVGCLFSTHRTSVAVHQYTYQHAGPFRGLSISTHISTLALPVDCSGDFGPRGLSVQYTQDVRGCPSAHTGRPWVSVSTHRTSLGVCQYTQDVRGCPCVSISTHRTSVAVHQHTQNFCGCPSVHISARWSLDSARWPFPWTVQVILPHVGCLFSTQTTSVGDRQHPQGVCGCSLAHTRRPWTVHQYTYQHAGPSRGLFGTSMAVHQDTQDIRGLSISTHISTLALPVDSSGDFGPRGLSVQYTHDVRGCPSAHTGRLWLSVSNHIHTGHPWVSVGVRQHTQDICGCPSAHTGHPLTVHQYTYQHI
uniref:Uncharacterized protein n=1 Tax=Brassica oleracea var. oleracea TaxID=109376 RepID=A0A0D3AW23_BRAOL